MVTVYGMSASGNCYKVKLLLEQLDLPYQWQETSAFDGATQSETFLAKNPNGKVPLLEIDSSTCLPESNAILVYLAEGSSLWPQDRLQRAQVLQWMFFEQYSHEPYIAVARAINLFLPADSPRRAELPKLLERGYQALAVMEQHLHSRKFFVGENYSVADIALYAYTHVAADGGFDLSRYVAVTQWLRRVAAQPGYIAIG
ncbi:MAG: glutathione S-transferase family protein [Spongiibacteraceae bacterium]